MTREKYKEICEYIKERIAGTQWDGKVYAVGGCCRDALLGREIQDVDLAVEVPGGGIDFPMWLYKKGLTVGKPVTFPKYCTSKFRLREFRNEELEAVQTRSEKYTQHNSRNPETAFGSLKEDCLRRDLTINSLYYDIGADRYIDYSGKGIADIERGVIRTPLDPNTTYDDDPVRILRTVRFAARYGWPIVPEAYEAMKRNVDRLEIIKPERLHQEFDKLIAGPNVIKALQMLLDLGVMRYLFPILYEEKDMTQGEAHDDNVWEHTLEVVGAVPADVNLRLAALLHDVGKLRTRVNHKRKGIIFPHHDVKGADMGRKMLRHLKYPLEDREEVAFLIGAHHLLESFAADGSDITEAQVKEWLRMSGSRRRFIKLMQLINAENNARLPGYRRSGQVEAVLKLLDSIMDEKPKNRRRGDQRRNRNNRKWRGRRRHDRASKANAE